jgi:hypothetical protein
MEHSSVGKDGSKGNHTKICNTDNKGNQEMIGNVNNHGNHGTTMVATVKTWLILVRSATMVMLVTIVVTLVILVGVSNIPVLRI